MTPPPPPDLTICVATYRRQAPPNLRTLVAALPAATSPFTFELVVVLNGPRADRASVPKTATVISNARNEGVPRAWNAGAQRSSGRILCFVNDDVLLGRSSLRMLAETLDNDSSIGVAGPVGTMWDISEGRHRAHLPPVVGLAAGTSRDCDVVSGFMFATPRAMFEGIGGFDEAFSPCGFEEVDYCTSVRRVGNARCVAVAGIDQSHDFAISSKRRWRRLRWSGGVDSLGKIADRNRAYFVRKWRNHARADGDANSVSNSSHI